MTLGDRWVHAVDASIKIKDKNIEICNIVGQSYGFMVDCAYITNKKKNVEFLLTAVVYTNANGVINDGKYEYESVALPYLASLGRSFYQYELSKSSK